MHSIREGQFISLTDGLYSHVVDEALNLPTLPLTVPPGHYQSPLGKYLFAIRSRINIHHSETSRERMSYNR